MINIKLMKAGGLHNAVKIANFAETVGVQCMMGCMLESKVGITGRSQPWLQGKRSLHAPIWMPRCFWRKTR